MTEGYLPILQFETPANKGGATNVVRFVRRNDGYWYCSFCEAAFPRELIESHVPSHIPPDDGELRREQLPPQQAPAAQAAASQGEIPIDQRESVSSVLIRLARITPSPGRSRPTRITAPALAIPRRSCSPLQTVARSAMPPSVPVSTTRAAQKCAEATLPNSARIMVGEALKCLASLPDESVQCVVTSPPYWGLRDYGVKGQLGLEKSPWKYIERMVAIFREIRRVLRSDGTVWVNMGDSYATGAGSVGEHPGGGRQGAKWKGYRGGHSAEASGKAKQRIVAMGPMVQPNRLPIIGLKSKDLVGMPWRLAFALQADGWYLRQDIIWSKPNAMPESVGDRCTKSHEYIFLLSKRRKYFYDAEAIKEEVTGRAHSRGNGINPKATVHGQHSRMQVDRDPRHLNQERLHRPTAWDKDMGSNRTLIQKQPRSKQNASFSEAISRSDALVTSRNKRSVWEVATQPFADAHFATFPEDLIVPCILAGTSEKGCCAKCGKPWERIVESRAAAGYPAPTGWDKGLGAHTKLDGHYDGKHSRSKVRSAANRMLGNLKARRDAGADHNGNLEDRATVGWKPTCKCDAPAFDVPVPCVVLDPFAGSGTTGVVALRYGRSFIGAELKPAYAAMAHDRIHNDAPLFNQVDIGKPRRRA